LKGGREYHFVDESIDVLRLQQALSEIFTKLPPQEKQIGQSEIEIAFAKVKMPLPVALLGAKWQKRKV
ncbi:MAG: hypothetical protein WA723_08860, partial [Pseudolabrys sp.]